MASIDDTAQAGPSSSSSSSTLVTPQNGSYIRATPALLAPYEASLPPTDALPYYDDEIGKPGMQAKVERALASEMGVPARKDGSNGMAQAAQVAEDRLPPPIELFVDRPHLRADFDRIAGGKSTEGEGKDSKGNDQGIDRSRYQLAGPERGLEAREEEWQVAIHNAEAQLMHSEGRLTNLELMKRFGANHWRLHNFQQEAFVKSFEAAGQHLQAETAAINRARKHEQGTIAGTELTRLGKRWAELLNRSLSVELANVVAAAEIEDLTIRRDALKAKLAAAAAAQES